MSAKDLAEFLRDERTTVRVAALKATLAVSDDANARALLFPPKHDKELCQESVDLLRALHHLSWHLQDSIARPALSALVNFASESSAAEWMARNGLVLSAMDAMLQTEKGRGMDDLYSGLLANITRDPRAAGLAMGEEESEARQLVTVGKVRALLSLSLTRGKAESDSLILYFGNVAQTSKIQAMLMGEGGDVFVKAMSLLDSERTVRRLGASAILKNLAMNDEAHDFLLDNDVVSLCIVPLILSPVPDESEIQGAPARVRSATEVASKSVEKGCESEPRVRLNLAETLLRLCTTEKGQVCIRDQKVYPFIRNLHLVEEDDRVKETIESIVARTELSTDT